MTEIDERKAVEAAITSWIAAANANNVDHMAALMAEQFELIPPGESPVSGAQAKTFLAGLFDGFVLSAACNTLELVVSGGLAYQRYNFKHTMTPKAGGEMITEQGHGIHLLQRQVDGSWKIAKDIWTSIPEAS